MLWLGLANWGFAAITVATYNVENYLVADRVVEGVYRPAYPKPETEKTALRQAIRAMSPDILALEEMGTRPFLEELQRDLKQEGVDYPYAEVLAAADPDRHVAVLSKLPFKEVRRHAQVPIKIAGRPAAVKRGVLEVTVATSAGDLTLFIVHLKSRRTEEPGDPEGAVRRLREAMAVRDLMLDHFPVPAGARFLLCGDWNDTPGSQPVATLVRRGDTAVGQILAAVDSHGVDWTHFYRRVNSHSRIDYILVSPGLEPVVVGGCARVYDGPEVGQASDHRPVFVRLDLDPVK